MQVPRKITMFYFCILLLFCCKENLDSKPKRRDIWTRNQNFLEGEYAFLDLKRMRELEIGKATEEKIYEIFGTSINIRLTYSKSPLPRIDKGKYIPIDKLIVYFDAKGIETEIPNGKGYETSEKLSVAFYLYKDKLQFYSIRHRDVIADKLLPTSTNDMIEYEKIDFGSLWPNQSCDRNYYDFKTLNFPKEKWYDNYIVCEWEKPDFEEKLKVDGYYDKL